MRGGPHLHPRVKVRTGSELQASQRLKLLPSPQASVHSKPPLQCRHCSEFAKKTSDAPSSPWAPPLSSQRVQRVRNRKEAAVRYEMKQIHQQIAEEAGVCLICRLHFGWWWRKFCLFPLRKQCAGKAARGRGRNTHLSPIAQPLLKEATSGRETGGTNCSC